MTVHVCKLFNVFSNYVTRKLRIYVYSSISRMITYLRVLQMIKHANKSLSWVKSVENTAISANEAASYLIAKTRSLQCISVYHLYTTLVLPVIEYSSFTWGLRPFDQISRIQNNLMRSFLRCRKKCPNSHPVMRFGVGI